MGSGSGSGADVPSVTSTTSAWPKYPPGAMAAASAARVGGQEEDGIPCRERGFAVAGDLVAVQRRGDMPVEFQADRVGGGLYRRGADGPETTRPAVLDEGAEKLDGPRGRQPRAGRLVVGGLVDVDQRVELGVERGERGILFERR